MASAKRRQMTNCLGEKKVKLTRCMKKHHRSSDDVL